jgi:hypothetical protein
MDIARRLLMNLHTVGIDLGKTVFHLVGLSRAGEVVVRERQFAATADRPAFLRDEPIAIFPNG